MAAHKLYDHPICHPDRDHQAFGLCNVCYQKHYRSRKPVALRYTREGHLRRRYKLSIEDFDRILKSQGGHCALCTMRPLPNYKNFCVDHDHKTKRIRGILCKFCNSKLGWFENRREIIEDYLNG